jgi:RNA recognition motif-containing protein
LFRKAGTVLRADVSLGPDNRSRGYGTVLLASAEDAGRAIDMFNGYSWQTRILEVRPDRLPPDIENPNNASNNSNNTLSVPSIISDMDYATLNLLGLGLDRPASSAGGGGRNLFVGNVSHRLSTFLPYLTQTYSYHFTANGKISRTFSVKPAPLYVQTSHSVKTVDLEASVRSFSQPNTMQNVLSRCSMDMNTMEGRSKCTTTSFHNQLSQLLR